MLCNAIPNIVYITSNWVTQFWTLTTVGCNQQALYFKTAN